MTNCSSTLKPGKCMTFKGKILIFNPPNSNSNQCNMFARCRKEESFIGRGFLLVAVIEQTEMALGPLLFLESAIDTLCQMVVALRAANDVGDAWRAKGADDYLPLFVFYTTCHPDPCVKT